ncbi:hypothetical protein [Marinobacterium sp. MBR-109]|jgi:hypothetical protein|uniref:hypothetical protein n=1 Tax=Marinobacterium sp. MBR-109 TaxID=3156462 RepID=UPI0033962F47
MSSGLLGAIGGLGQGLANTGQAMFGNELEKMKEQRLQEWKEQLVQREWDREDRMRAEDLELASNAAHSEREWEREKLGLQHQNAKELAGMKERSMSGRYKASTWTDPDTGMKEQRVLDTWTGEWADGGAGASSGASPATPEMEARAREIARERADQQAGWLSSDSSDFAEYGGSRQAAEEQFYREELEKLKGGGSAGGGNPLIQAIQSGKIKVNDPAAQSSAAPASTQAQPQSAMPQAQPFNPAASVGLLNSPAVTNNQPQDWQTRNQQYEAIKPAIEMVRKKLDAGWAPEQEELERVRPYLTEKEIRLAEQRIMERKQYR